LLKEVSKCPLKPTEEFIRIKHGRDLLKKKLTECNEGETKIHLKRRELEELTSSISKRKTSISDLHKKLIQMVKETYWQAVPTSYYNTTCLACKKCCHEQYGLEKTEIQESEILKKCYAFSGENCRECGHHYSSHVHLMERYVEKTREIPSIDPTVKHNIDKLQNENAQKEEILKNIQEKIKELDVQLDKLHLEIQDIVTV